jgi:hypothetical protein
MHYPDTGLYRHYKGNLYQLLSVARHSETQEVMAVYQCLYGEYQVWVRPLDMFLEHVQLDNGQSVPRFEFIQRNF